MSVANTHTHSYDKHVQMVIKINIKLNTSHITMEKLSVKISKMEKK